MRLMSVTKHLASLTLAAGLMVAGGVLAQEPAPVSLAYVPKAAGQAYFDLIAKGFGEGCKALGCAYETIAPGAADPAMQVTLIASQAQRKVDVLAVSPNSPTALNEVLDKARLGGTLVITVNMDMPGQEQHRDAAVMPADFARIGPDQVELLGSFIDYQGEIAIVASGSETPDRSAWVAAMKETLASDPKYAEMTLMAVVDGEDDPKASAAAVERLLLSYPDLKGILAPTAVGLAAAAEVVENAGKVEQIRVTGLGTPNQMRRFIKSRSVRAFHLWNPYNQGLVAAHFAHGVIKGAIFNHPGESFEVPGVGTVTIGPDNVINAQSELTVFNLSNIDDFDF